MKRHLFFSAIVYTITTFLLAILWHIVLFEKQYLAFGYFGEKPNFLLGFLSIAIQGVALSWLYPRVKFSGTGIKRGLKFALCLGVLHWTCHVLAFLAKQETPQAGLYLLMESFYLLLQFGIYGVCVGWIYSAVGSHDS